MTRTEPPSADDLREGLRHALDLFLLETDLSHAVGENGRMTAHVEVHLERGVARWTKGAVAFERRIDMGGTSGR
jgi:hypothetical protein